MLQTFLTQNRGSLLTNLNFQPLRPSQCQLKKQRGFVFEQKVQNVEVYDRVTSRSPGYRRKKIFQRNESPQSQVTAGFKEIDFDESFGEGYIRPIEQQKGQEGYLANKKTKLNKQNGLFVATSKLDIRQSQRSTLDTIPSQNQLIPEQLSKHPTPSTQPSNQPKPQLVQSPNQQSQCSLDIRQNQFELFTFNSEGTISFQYSQSGVTNGSKSESLVRVGSPRDGKLRPCRF